MNSPDLQTNLVYHIINISQRLKGKIKAENQENMKKNTYIIHPKNLNV